MLKYGQWCLSVRSQFSSLLESLSCLAQLSFLLSAFILEENPSTKEPKRTSVVVCYYLCASHHAKSWPDYLESSLASTTLAKVASDQLPYLEHSSQPLYVTVSSSIK